MCVCVRTMLERGEGQGRVCVRAREGRGRREREGSSMGGREREVWRELVSRGTRKQLCSPQTNTCRLGGKEHFSEVPPRVVR